jgi:hypothetical protein
MRSRLDRTAARAPAAFRPAGFYATFNVQPQRQRVSIVIVPSFNNGTPKNTQACKEKAGLQQAAGSSVLCSATAIVQAF